MAGSGRRVFAPGEVLTASNTMNYFMDQTVMNFAGTAARGSAIGTAVSEGMVSYLADTNDVQVYDGSAWLPLAFESYADAKSGLVPVAPSSAVIATGSGSTNSLGVVSFTGATAVSLNGVFGTDTFLSYRVIIRIVTATALSARLDMRLRVGGVDNTTSNAYAHAGIQNIFGTASGGVGSGGISYHYLGNLLTEGNSATIDIHNPATTNRTTYQGYWFGWNGNIQTLINGGLHNQNVIYDGLSIIPTSGTITGQIQVFGYND
jgi:hypothetical protein